MCLFVILVARIFTSMSDLHMYISFLSGIPSFLLHLLLYINVLTAGNATEYTRKPLGDSKSCTVKYIQSFNGASQEAHTPNIEGYYVQYLLQHEDSHASKVSCIFCILVRYGKQ